MIDELYFQMGQRMNDLMIKYNVSTNRYVGVLEDLEEEFGFNNVQAFYKRFYEEMEG